MAPVTVALALTIVFTSNARFVEAFATPPSSTFRAARSPPVVALAPLAAAAGETEAEALLRKARELKAQAAAAEESLRANLSGKKAELDAETDALVDRLFPTSSGDGSDLLIDRLRDAHPSTPMLVRTIERLHEREVAARGLSHVEPSSHHDHTKFEVVSERNEAELARLEGLIDRIIEAASALDRERVESKVAKGEGGVRHHAEVMHWSEGDVAKVLMDKVGDLRREHDEQFQKRLKSFYDAARKEDSKM